MDRDPCRESMADCTIIVNTKNNILLPELVVIIIIIANSSSDLYSAFLYTQSRSKKHKTRPILQTQSTVTI